VLGSNVSFEIFMKVAPDIIERFAIFLEPADQQGSLQAADDPFRQFSRLYAGINFVLMDSGGGNSG